MEASRLGPGPCESTSGLEITSGDLILAGLADDVWILQMASANTTTKGRQAILIGSARSPNVFLQRCVSTALMTNPLFEGTREADQSVTLIAGPMRDDGASARTGAAESDLGTVKGLGGDA